MSYLDDDENVKAMRETAEVVGLTQLLLDIQRSPALMGSQDIDRLCKALAILGVSDDDDGPQNSGEQI